MAGYHARRPSRPSFANRLRSLAASMASPSTRRRRGFSGGAASCESLEDRKLMTAGYYDPSFGDGGKVVTHWDQNPYGFGEDTAAAVAVDGWGRTYVAGSIDYGNGDRDMAVSRYLSDGSLDLSYGIYGRAYIAFDVGGNKADLAADIAIDYSGRAVVVGTVDYSYSDTDFGIAVLRENGTLDTGFNGTGKARVAFDLGGVYRDEAAAVAIDQFNRIVVAGTVDRGNGNTDMAVVRLWSNGAMDGLYGNGGKVVAGFDMGGTNADRAADVAIDATGAVVVAGTAQVRTVNYWSRYPSVQIDDEFAVFRLNASGYYDTSFSGDGRQTIAFDKGGSRSDTASALAIDAQGRIVVAGTVEYGNGDFDFGVTRLDSAGNIDTTFGYNGRTTVAFDLGGTRRDELNDMALDAEGRIVLAGTVDRGNYNSDIGTARLTADGQRDYSYGNYGLSVAGYDLGPGGNLADRAAGVAIDPWGRILVAATVDYYGDDEWGLIALQGD